MPVVGGSIVCAAPPLAVWRLVHDPARMPEWLSDTLSVEPGEDGTLIRYLRGGGEMPFPTVIQERAEPGRLVFSCLVSDIDFSVELAPHPEGCRVVFTVTMPEREARKAPMLQATVDESLRLLARRATAEGGRLG